MKLTAILLVTAFLTVSAGSNAQKITLNEVNAPMEKLFKEIWKQSGFQFVYTDKTLAGAKPVTINVKDEPLENVLKLCFAQQPFEFTITDGAIVIKQKPTPVISNERSEEKSPAALVDVKGRLVNEQNEPVPGASIKVKGTTNGTTTNANGEFTLTGVNENATLVFTGTNIETFEKKIGTNGDLGTITARIKISALNEVIINKGYYTEKQKYSVSNVGRVTAKDIEKQPVNNPLLALQGRVPGLFITQASGISGGAVTVRIQGQNSILRGNDPFYVIDGVPYSSQLPTTGIDNVLLDPPSAKRGNPLFYINPSDIESIEVLKDADATAIYGSRAANGAILITTKKGKAGKSKVNINLQQGWGNVTRKMDLLNTRQYLDMRYEAYKNDNIDWRDPSVDANDLKVWDTTRNTDWQKVLIGGTAKYTHFNADFSGGTSLVQYLIGATYHRETTVFPTDLSDRRIATHFSLNTVSANQKFHLQFSGNYMFDDNLLPVTDLTSRALITAPVAPSLYNADGGVNWAPDISGNSTWNNPIVDVLYSTYNNKTRNLVASAFLSYSILPGMEVKSSFGYTNLQTNDFNSIPWLAMKPEDRPFNQRQASYGERSMDAWNIEPQLTYKRTIGNGKFEGLAGFSIQQNNNSTQSFFGTGYNSDDVLRDIKSAASIRVGSSLASEYKYNAAFGRLNYNLDDKYIINLTARRDGSSRFGDQNKFHNFWSIGGAWIFSQEEFFKKAFRFISFGKIKASYGTTGSDQISDYTYLSLYNVISANVPYQNTTGLSFINLPNPYIQWEETKKLQVGIDLGFMDDRIQLGATYIDNRSSNQLLSYPLPLITGFSNFTDNLPATVQNNSWEFVVSTSNLKGNNLIWNSNLNLTIPENRLKSFANLASSSYANKFVIGEPVNLIKASHFMGVSSATGEYLFRAANGNPVTTLTSINESNMFIHTFPKFYGGFQNSLEYKGFQLDFLIQYVRQTGKNMLFFNGLNGPGSSIIGYSNQPASVLNRWQKPGDISAIRKYGSDYFSLDGQMTTVNGSDASYSDASYMRLKNLSLSWRLPVSWKSKLKIQDSRIYVQGQNLLTVTKYKGMDPENQSTNTLPPLRVLTFGLQVSL